MQSVLSPENARTLDRLLKTMACEQITIDTTAMPTIQAVSSDLSQYTLIRLEPSFFSSYAASGLAVSMPTPKFYWPEMKSLKISLLSDRAQFEYDFGGLVHKKSMLCLPADPLDLEFVPLQTVRADMACIHQLLKGVKDKYVTIAVEDGIEVACEGRRMCIDAHLHAQRTTFRVCTDALRAIVSHAADFSDHAFVFSETGAALNVIFRRPDVFLSIFVSIDCV